MLPQSSIARLTLAVCAATLIAIGAVLVIAPQGFVTGPNGRSVSTGTAQIGGAYDLVDHTGRQVSHATYLGKYKLMYFGFTSCPDICPGELQVISAALDQLEPDTREKLQPIFITVDPERDDVDAMANYVSLFHENFVGLTGTTDQIRAITRAYRVFATKVPLEDSGGDYTIDHSSIIYLMDTDGTYLAHFPYGTGPDDIAGRLKSLVN